MKAPKKLNYIHRIKKLLPRKSLEILYLTYGRSIFDYADIVWDNCTTTRSNRLKKLQVMAARIVTGGPRGTSHAELYKETVWQTLQQRRCNHRLIFMLKIITTIAHNI